MARFSRLASIFALCIVLVNCPRLRSPRKHRRSPGVQPGGGRLRRCAVCDHLHLDGGGRDPLHHGRVRAHRHQRVGLHGAHPGVSHDDHPGHCGKDRLDRLSRCERDVHHQRRSRGGAIRPSGGAYDRSATVTLTTATEGAQIYYTTDGSQPDPASGVLYTGPISITTSQTIMAVGVKQSMTNSAVASAEFTIKAEVPPVTDAEIDAARNALARAREVDADYFDPDNYDSARQLLDEGVSLRTSDPAAARQKLSDSKDKADLAFTNSVEKSAAVMAANLEAARNRLLALEADKFLPDDFQKATAGIDESAALCENKDYSGARARAYQALKEMTDLGNRLESRLAAVKSVKYETEQLMKQAESEELYSTRRNRRTR